MVNFDQGPGRNIEFCLISSGIDLDPDHGCNTREYYSWLKSVINERAEIHFENPIIRQLPDRDVDGILEGYSSGTPRTVWQFLFGLVEHSNGWTPETLTAAIDSTPFPRSLDPKDGEYSIDFVQSLEDGMILYKNEFIIGTDVWIEQETFYYSSCRPILLDGEPGDVWLVTVGDNEATIEFWHKPAFQWIQLVDFVSTATPPGTFFISDTDPGNSTNSWWLDTTGINIRKYSVSLNTWEPVGPITVSPTPPGGAAEGDLWLKVVGGKLILHVFDASINVFKTAKLSKRAVQDRATNSAFVGTPGNNNFIIVCGDPALQGVPFGDTGDLRIKKDDILVESMVTCINLIGPDLQVTSPGPGEVDIEHLPFTCLPEQSSAPTAVPEAGKVFTLDIGGITELFYIDDSGTLIQLTNNGISIQNVFFAVSTSSASADQTVFSVPATAISILAFKINGVDTTAFTFSSPSVTYLPGVGGYDIQDGDVVTILFYG